MPRRPKPANANNPLRCLRIALGTDETPLPQHELARRLGISVETIKSVEGARRRQGMPGREILDSVSTHLGALWSEEKRQWDFRFSNRPYTRTDYERYTKATFDRDVEAHALCLRLISLLQRVSAKDFPVVSDTVEQSILMLAHKYGIDWKVDLREGNLVLSPIWKNGKETGDLADIVGYERSRAWMRDEADGKWKKRNRKSKLFNFRDRLQKDESPKT